MWQRPVCPRCSAEPWHPSFSCPTGAKRSADCLQDDRGGNLHQVQAPEPAGTIGAGSIGHRVGERESLGCSSLRRVRSIQVPVQLITMGVALVTLEGSGATSGQIASNPRLDRRLVEPPAVPMLSREPRYGYQLRTCAPETDSARLHG